MTDTRARMLQELPVVYLTAFTSCAVLCSDCHVLSVACRQAIPIEGDIIQGGSAWDDPGSLGKISKLLYPRGFINGEHFVIHLQS